MLHDRPVVAALRFLAQAGWHPRPLAGAAGDDGLSDDAFLEYVLNLVREMVGPPPTMAP
jgi:hypothetical protein